MSKLRSRLSASRAGWRLALACAPLAIGAATLQAATNTEYDVATGASDLTAAGTYTTGGTAGTGAGGTTAASPPSVTSDVTFDSGLSYSPTAFTLNGNLTVGSLDDLNTAATLSISNTSGSGTGSVLTLGGAGDLGNSVSGTAADLLYVASGAALTINGGSGATALGISVGQAGNFNVVGTATISSNIGGSAAITSTGAGTLTLSGTNAFSGGLNIKAGTTSLGSSAALPAANAVAFTGGASTLNLGSNNAQTIAALSGAGTATGAASFAVTGSNSSLSVSGGAGATLLYVPVNTGATTDVLDLSATTSFTFNYSAQAITIYGGANGSGSPLAPTTVADLRLSARTNSITASALNLGSSGTGSQLSGAFPLAEVELGASNTLNIGSGGLYVSAYRDNGLLTFQSGLTNPTVTIRGVTGGVSPLGLWVVGDDASGGGSTEGAADLSNSAGTGAGSVNAIVTSMIVGENAQNNANQTGQGTFTMSLGTLNAGSIVLANSTGTTNAQTAVSTFTQQQGTVLANSITLLKTTTAGNMLTATYNLGTSSLAGTLSATTIGIGPTASNTASRAVFNFNNGTITNFDPALGQSGSTGAISGDPTSPASLTISGAAGGGAGGNNTTLTINLASTGTHTLSAESGYTVTVASTALLTGSGALGIAGAGSVTLAGANTYTGGTSIASGATLVTANAANGSATGTAAVTANGALADTAVGATITGPVTITNGGSLQGNSSAVFSLKGGLTLNSGASFQLALNAPNLSSAPMISASSSTLTVASGTVVNLTGSAADRAGTYYLLGYGANADPFADLTLGTTPTGFSYQLVNDTANDSVDLAVTPEPASTALLSAGAIGLLLRRRRRRGRSCRK